ncbi:SIS domain-containing protein [Klebsiella sp. BIGb0407]|uniref:SIS domain-containing protein n=1 Tax=Klebsiella sp. BIGb0407 TaxID=2940603 RepID=UPI00216A5D5D|nr:SIS domain-containing protein [Klebsiella sp. BIGb0407]MCS3432956.1 putative phosphosugar-binding protein [Klebsiella sp. BIGb0407]
MNGFNEYLKTVKNNLTLLANEQQNCIQLVAEKLTDVIANDGIIYLFGCGHSHIFGEDVFYRAGGLAPVRPILIEPLMLHQGAARSSQLEKQNNYINEYLQAYPITSNDALIVISTSGINPAPIDAILWGNSAGATTIAITSFIYAEKSPSRHLSGKYLRDCADIAIDNHVPYGDAVLTVEDNQPPFAPVSSALGIVLLQAIFAQVIFNLSHRHIPLPVFLSGNIPGSTEHNTQLVNQYSLRIPELSKGL